MSGKAPIVGVNGVRNVESPGAAPRCLQGEYSGYEMFGIAINSISMTEFFHAVDRRVASGSPAFFVTPNVDHVCMCRTDRDLREAYQEADLVLPDGVPLMWAARLAGKPLKAKLSGSDLIYLLSRHAAERGFSVYFLGGAEGVAEETARRLEQRYPGLRVAGTDCPPHLFETDEAIDRSVIERVRKAKPDICYVAIGSPRQEKWMAQHYVEAGAPVMLGVGASFDFVCGRQRRAPRVVQKAGLEWFWRLCRDPKRLWRRYLVRDARFVPIFLAEVFRKKNSSAHRAPTDSQANQSEGNRYVS